MTTVTKPVDEDRISTIQAQLDQAIAAEATAAEVSSSMAGLHVLGEATNDDKTTADEALSTARTHTASLRSAIDLLRQREKAHEAANAAARVERLRKESASAQTLQAQALQGLAKAATGLSASLEVVKAQGVILSGIHTQLAQADPERNEQADRDYRDSLAMVGTRFAAKRAAIKNAAASAQYQLQSPSDGSNPAVEKEIPLPHGGLVPTGTPFAVARAKVLDSELAALSAIDREQRDAEENAYQEHCARTETSGLGSLPLSRNEISAASNLDPATVGLLLDDGSVRALAGLELFLPASSTQGVSVRSIPRTALDARIEEQALENGRNALRALSGH